MSESFNEHTLKKVFFKLYGRHFLNAEFNTLSMTNFAYLHWIVKCVSKNYNYKKRCGPTNEF